MRPVPVLAGVSLQDYLEFERSSSLRHEYADGEVFAISSGPLEHSGVVASIIGELGRATLAVGCRVLTSDMRIKVLATSRYVYPDVSVVCDHPELEDEHRDTLLNPRVVVEVLSEASEAYDRGDKFAQYRTIAALHEYVLASHRERRLEVFTRQKDGSWLLRIYGPGDLALLSSIGCAVDVDRVYADVFEPDPRAKKRHGA